MEWGTYKLTIEWSDGSCEDVSHHESVAKAGEYLTEEGRLSNEAAVAILEGREPNVVYTKEYDGEHAIRIVKATLELEVES